MSTDLLDYFPPTFFSPASLQKGPFLPSLPPPFHGRKRQEANDRGGKNQLHRIVKIMRARMFDLEEKRKMGRWAKQGRDDKIASSKKCNCYLLLDCY